MLKRIVIAIFCFSLILGMAGSALARESRPARPKNLYRLVENNPVTVYVGDITSDSSDISAENFRNALNEFLSKRARREFIVTDSKEKAKIMINAKIKEFKYLEEDPVDHIVGGLSGLLVDAAVDQNYARIDVTFDVIRVKDGKRIWHRNYYSTVTQANMPKEESIPKALNACNKRFVSLCFSKPKR